MLPQPSTSPPRDAGHRRRPRGVGGGLLWLLGLVLLGWLAASPAAAVVIGTYPSAPKAYKVYGKAVQLGASLVTNFTDYRFNDKLLPQSSDTVKIAQKLPEDAVIVGAFLFWGGSATAAGPDDLASLTVADGFSSQVEADSCDVRTDPSGSGTHFLCRKDVTALVASHPGTAQWNGTYSLGSVDARVASVRIPGPGDPPCPPKWNGSPEDVCCAPGDAFCQARHASWSLVMVYDTKFSETTQRDVFLYDGFVALDEKTDSTGQIFFTIKDFLVGDPPDAQLSFYALEGDKQLGNPAQDPPGTADSPPCATCFDFVQFNGTKLTGGAGNNAADNIMNSTPEAGIDLDTFDISGLVKTGDTTASFLVSSGNGSLADNQSQQVVQAGAGELFFYAYTLLQINRKAPNFKNVISKLSVDAAQASAGDVLTFSIDLLNNGQLDADNSVVQLDQFPPAGTEYVANSTQLDGKVVADSGAASPMQAGLNIGTLTNPAGGNSSRKITFKLRIKSPPGVTQVTTFPIVNFTYVGSKGSPVVYKDQFVGSAVTVQIVAPQLAQPTLSVAPSTAKPGDTVVYGLTLKNTSNTVALTGFTWSAPKEGQLSGTVDCSLDALGAGTSVQQNVAGGANQTGQITASGLIVGAAKTVTCTWKLTLLSADQLTAKGVAPINGAVVLSQATVTTDTKTTQTDDPNLPGATDATRLTLSALTSFVSSTKTISDLSPATPLSPGDQVRFDLTLVNSGAVGGTVTVTDPLPGQLVFVSSLSPELTVNGTTVSAKDVSVAAGATKVLSFVAQVKADTPPGSTFANVATLSPADGGQPTVIQTPQQTVQGGVDLSTSAKTVSDLNGGDLEPGDTLQYTITLKNTGKIATGAFQVVDPIDPNLGSVAAVTAGGVLDAAAKQVTWAVPSIAAGGQAVLQFQVKVGDLVPTGTTISNTATASGGELVQPVPLTVAVKVQAQPLISLFSLAVASSAGTTYQPGDTATYTLSVQNTGSGVVQNAKLVLSLDGVLGSIAASAGGTVSGQTVTWNLGTLQKGAPPQTLTVSGKLAAVIAQGKQVAAQASLSGDGLGAAVLSDDPAAAGQSDPTLFTVTSAPNLTASLLSFTDLNGGQVQGGDTVQYKVTVSNSGNAPATNVVLSDVLAPQLTQPVLIGGTFNPANQTATWNAIPTLEPGKPVEVVFTVVVAKNTPSGTVVSNAGQLAFDQTPKTAVTNTVQFSVVNLPDFGASTKAASAQVVQAGDTVTWTLTIINSGNQAASNVVVSDPLPKELVQPQLSDGGTVDGSGTAKWTLPTLAAGAQKVLTVTAQVQKPLAKGTQICNQAQIVAAENPTPSLTSPPGQTPQPQGQPTCIAVDSAAQLTVTKDVFDVQSGAQLNGGVVKPKQTLRYVIRVKNGGNAVAQDVVVTDLVPAGLVDVVPLDGGQFNAQTATLTWPTAGSLGVAATDELVVRFEATVPTAADNGAAIANQAQVVYAGIASPQPSDDPKTVAKTDPTQVVVQANIDFSKATLTAVDDNGGELKPGDKVTYTLVVSNDGDGIAKDVSVVLPVDAKLVDLVAGQDGAVTPGTVIWKAGQLEPGQKVTLTLQATVNKPLLDGAKIAMQAQVVASGFAAPVLSDANLATPVREATVLQVAAKPDLSGSTWTLQDLNGGPFEPGDTVLLQLTVRNTGDGLAQLVAAKALLQPGTWGSVQPFDGGQLTGDQVSWTIPLVGLSPTGDITLTIQAKLAAGLQDGQLVQVVAQLPGVANPPTAQLTVSAKPRFDTSQLTVEDETGWVAKAGQTAPSHVLRVEAIVQNAGKSAADGLTVTLPLPPKTVASEVVTPGGSVQGGTVVWTLPSLAAGGSIKLVAKVTVAADAQNGDKLPFTLTATAAGLPQPQTVAGPTLTVTLQPILKLTKSWQDLSGKHLFPGDGLRFTLTALNAGNAVATNLVIRDDVPPSVGQLVAESGGAVSGQTVTWSIPTLAPGQTVAVSLRGTLAAAIPTGSVIVNQGTAEAEGVAPVPSNALQVAVDYPTLQVQLGLLPEAPAKLPLQPGDVVALQVQVQALTGADGKGQAASGVQVSAGIDASVFEPIALQGASFDTASQTLRWSAKDNTALQALAPGKPVVLLAGLKVKATAADGKQAQFTAVAREGETQLDWAAEPKVAPIESKPKLKINKTVKDLNGGKVQPQDVLRYSLEVRVDGKAAAQQVQISDVLDPALELVAVAAGGSNADGKLSWTPATTAGLGLVLPGQTVSLQFDARVRATAADGQVVANQAVGLVQGSAVEVLSDDPATAAENDPTLLQVRVQSALEASTKTVKDDNGGALLAGETLTWTINLVATSPQPLTGVKLLDALPVGTDYVSGSTTVNGVAVPDGPGQSLPLLQGLVVGGPGLEAGVLAPGPEKAAVVSFRTRVRPDLADGTLVGNLATAIAADTPPTPVGPAALAVGKAPSLKGFAKTVEILDGNGNGVADVGEEVRYTLAVANAGAGTADEVTVEDPLASGLQYVGGSMLLDGASVSDAQDLDGARFDAAAKTIRASLASVAPGQTRQLAFRVRVLQGPLVANQASVVAKGLPSELSDSDGNDGNGNQPTVTAIGSGTEALQVGKAVQDENGGQVQRGDVLRYTVQVKNLGAAALEGVQLLDPLPAGLQPTTDQGAGAGDLLLPGDASAQWKGTIAAKGPLLQVTGLRIEAGETATVTFRVRVGDQLEAGTILCNVAEGKLSAGAQFASKPACATVGAVVGEGIVRGVLFEDVGVQDGVYQPGIDQVLPGFQVQVGQASGQGPLTTAIADAKGQFRLVQVPEGKRQLRVLNANGVVFAQQDWEAPGQQGGVLDIAIKPMGRLYDPQSGELVAGVRLFLSYDQADPIAPGQPVPAELLLPGQQGQKTDASGAYAFAAPAGRAYRIDVAAASAGRAFPSVRKAAEPGLALLDGQGYLVAEPLPQIQSGLPRYVTRFSMQGAIAPPLPKHNHLPVDKLSSLVHVSVRLSRAQAQIGELMGVTVQVVNGSTAAIAPDAVTGQGGAELRHILPPGLGLVEGTARLALRRQNGQEVEVPLAPLSGSLLTVQRLSPVTGQPVGLELPPGGQLTLRMVAAVGASATTGTQLTTFAQLFDRGGGALSSRAEAGVLVQADPLFDRAGVLAKVFCDGNGDGQQQEGEDGLPGVRIYVDTGEYAASDAHGRLHFVNLPGGTHLFKADPDTLPPGSTFSDGQGKQAILLTRGLTQSLRFGVRCSLQPVGPGQLEVVPAEDPTPVQPGPGVVLVEADARTLDIAIDGKKQGPRRVLARLATAADRPLDLSPDRTAWALPSGGELAVWLDGTTGFTRHNLELREEGKDALLFESSFNTDLPRRQVFALARGEQVLSKLLPGKHYVLRVVAETAGGSRVVSAPMPFEVRAADAAEPLSWTLKPGVAAWFLNGQPMEMIAGRALLHILRPADGRLLVAVHGANGSVRAEYMSLPKLASKDTVIRPALVTDWPQLVAGQSSPNAAVAAPATTTSSSAAAAASPAPSSPAPSSTTPAPAATANPPPPPTNSQYPDFMMKSQGVQGGANGAATSPPAASAATGTTPPPAVAAPVAPPPQPPAPRATATAPPPSPPAAAPRPPPSAETQYPDFMKKSNGLQGSGEPDPPPAAPPRAGPPAPQVAPPPVALPPAPPPASPLPPAPQAQPMRLSPQTLAFTATARGVRVGDREWLARSGQAKLQVPAVPVPLAGGSVLGQVMLSVRDLPDDAREVALVLLDAQGAVRARSSLGVPVPSSFYWAPSAKGLVPGQYGLALEVLMPDGQGLAGYRTAPWAVTFANQGPALLPASDPDKNVRATLFDGQNAPTESTVEWLQTKLAVAITAEKDRIAVVSVHDDGGGDAQQRTDSAASQIETELLLAKVPRDRFIVVGVGNQVADFKPNRGGLGPHRIELRWRSANTGSSVASVEPFAVPAGLWIDGQRRDTSGALPASLELQPGQKSRIVYRKADGSTAIWVQQWAVTPGAGGEELAPQGSGRDVAGFGADLLDALRRDVRAVEQGKPRVVAAQDAPLLPVQLASGATEMALPAAADLQVWLPPADKELGAPEIAVRGRTRPGNKITVQGQAVPVAGDGQFYTLVPLPMGASTLNIISTDGRGNKATLQRNLKVKERALFVMAIADTSVSHVAAHLVDIEREGGARGWDNGAWTVGDSVQLMGRGAAYLKGRIAGRYLGVNNLRFTAHVDTAKDPQLADFATNLIDPTRFYPVYGDGATQVQDVQARGRLYVLVEADQGKMQLGNFRAGVQGIELLRYDRALYGARVETQLQPAEGMTTKASVFGAVQDRRVARRTDVLRGTGGSLYYLSARDVLEGSERVEMVIRDRASGLEIARLPQARNNDYTIDYREGRLLFKSPVTSAVDGALALGQNGVAGAHLTWNGQPVTLEVIYEARGAVASDDGAVGGQVKQTLLGGKVALGVGYVQEGRSEADPTYRAVGADASVKFLKASQASVEYAYTQSRDTLLSVSDDGGLTFGAPKYATTLQSGGAAVDGHAIKAQFDVALSDAGVGAAAALAADATPTGPGRVKGWYQWVQAGFQSGGTIAQQGQQRFGLDGNVAVSSRNAVTVRYDGLVADSKQADLFGGPGLAPQWGSGPLANSGSFSAWNRHTLVVQDAHRLDARWTATAAAAWGWSLSGDDRTSHSATLGGGAQFKASSRLTLRGDQQVIAWGDPALMRSWGDRFITTLGAEYKLDKSLALTLTERLGWGGQNSTAAGLRTWLDKDTSLYAQQRLEDTLLTGRPTSATVLGAETRYGKDQLSRAFAEYQVDALNTGAMNRATMGVGKRFVVAEGVTVDAGYERQQVFSGPSGELGRDALSVGGEWLRSGWFKLTTRQEVRLDKGDPSSGGVRKLQVLSLNNGTIGLGRDLTLFGRANYLRTQNQTLDSLEAESLESTLGLAYRPVRTNWLNVLAKLTRLAELRPTTAATGPQLRSDKLIAALEPTVELPYSLQASFKAAWQQTTERLPDVDVSATSDRWLWVTRLGWHATPVLDLAAEYRYLATPLVYDHKHGALLEAAYLIAQAVRVGVGYNFSHIVQTPAGDIQTTTDNGGFYLRLIGLY